MKLFRRKRLALEERQRQERLRNWMRDMHEWSLSNPDEPVMRALITRDGSEVQWNGPKPDIETQTENRS